jgi:hypothetical protein
MREPLRCYDYVNQPFVPVRDALRADARGIFARATGAATSRAEVLAAQLQVRAGAVAIAADVDIQILAELETTSPFGSPATEFQLAWRSLRSPQLFPAMAGALSVYALSSSETQLEFRGDYEPPLGLLGDAFDALIGRRIAEACVLRFVQDVAERLRRELASAR